MKIPIFQIKINDGRREADPETVYMLTDSISKLDLLNPITVDQDCTLIAGLHQLEAAKRLGWPEIDCNVSSFEGLLAELAERDENFVRKGLSEIEYGDLLLKRKCMVLSLRVPLLNRPVGWIFPVMGWLRFPARWPLGKLTFCWWKTFPALTGTL